MTKGLRGFLVFVLAIPAGLAAQDRYSLPPTVGGDAWRVADPTPSWPPLVLPSPPAPVYVHPPQQVPAPVTAYRPVIPVAPPPAQYYLGRGIFGQPKLYVPEQPVRNFLRYFSF